VVKLHQCIERGHLTLPECGDRLPLSHHDLHPNRTSAKAS
jgi:hypothetical protein